MQNTTKKRAGQNPETRRMANLEAEEDDDMTENDVTSSQDIQIDLAKAIVPSRDDLVASMP